MLTDFWHTGADPMTIRTTRLSMCVQYSNNRHDHDKAGRRPPLDFDLAHHCTSIRVDPGYGIRYVSCIFCYFVYITMSVAPITHQRYVEITWTEVHSGLSCTTSWEVLHVGELPWQPGTFIPCPDPCNCPFHSASGQSFLCCFSCLVLMSLAL
jgi:hypothetical protein